MTAEDLADRLVGSGKPINSERIAKFARHLQSRQHLEDTLACLTDEQAEAVRALIEPYLRRLV